MKAQFYKIMVIAVIAIAFASCEKESKEMAIINSESQIVKNEGSDDSNTIDTKGNTDRSVPEISDNEKSTILTYSYDSVYAVLEGIDYTDFLSYQYYINGEEKLSTFVQYDYSGLEDIEIKDNKDGTFTLISGDNQMILCDIDVSNTNSFRFSVKDISSLKYIDFSIKSNYDILDFLKNNTKIPINQFYNNQKFLAELLAMAAIVVAVATIVEDCIQQDCNRQVQVGISNCNQRGLCSRLNNNCTVTCIKCQK
jgi:hypothetical protein